MSEKISEYTTSVTALASGDLMDVSKLISTSPLEYQSQKLNYSVLLTELNADLGFIDGSGTTNKISKFTASGTIGDSSISDDGTNVSTLQAVGIGIATPTSKLHIVGDAATQTTASLLIKNSIGGELIKLLNDGSSLIGINTFAVTDGNAFNNSLGFYTNGTVLKARYKNNAGISSDLVISSNLGSENLTSADDARTFTLKSGGTASQNLQFLNSGGGNLLTLYGNKNIEFGSSSNTLTELLINLSGTAGTFRMASGSNAYAIYYDAPVFNFSIRSATLYKVDIFGGTGSIVATGDTSSGYYLNKIGGTPAAALYNYNGSNFYMNNSAGTRLINIETVNGFGHVVGGWAVGLAYSIVPTARLQVKGSGSTSATTTALFENSASVAALKVKDDGYCILKANNAAIASGDLSNNEMSFYIDEGTNHCVVKVKYSSGTVKTGTFNLT